MPRIPRHPSRTSARVAEPSRRWCQLSGLLILGGGALVWLGELARHMAAP